MYSDQTSKTASVYALLRLVKCWIKLWGWSDRKGTQIKENKTLTQIDRDDSASSRVDSAIMVAIRSAGGVNEGAETLKAEGGLRCATWWLKMLSVTLPNEQHNQQLQKYADWIWSSNVVRVSGWGGGCYCDGGDYLCGSALSLMLGTT